MTVTFKDLNKKKNQLGQFMTPNGIVDSMLDNNQYNGLIIEPSFGLGAFLSKLENKYPVVIGIEFDPDLYNQYKGNASIYNQSFYKFTLPADLPVDAISFIVNPPYRNPAFSLTSPDKPRVIELSKKYHLSGIKEEAVFFKQDTVAENFESAEKIDDLLTN